MVTVSIKSNYPRQVPLFLKVYLETLGIDSRNFVLSILVPDAKPQPSCSVCSVSFNPRAKYVISYYFHPHFINEETQEFNLPKVD